MSHPYLQVSPRQEAVLLLLAEPDPPEMPPRRHVWTHGRTKDPDQQKQELILAWLAWREMEYLDLEQRERV